MQIPTEEELLAAACHFGHPKQKWNPKMAPYLYGTQRGIHIFDLVQTRQKLMQCAEALRSLQEEGKTILFVSTKQQSIAHMERMAAALGQPVVTKKWIAGLLTNWSTIKKRLQWFNDLRHSFATGEVEKYTKKEQLELRRQLTKLDAALGGVSDMKHLPDAVVVVDAVRDSVAVKEARKIRIPVYGICDSNADPDDFTVAIPANDDAVKAIDLILSTLETAMMNAKKPQKTPALAATGIS